MARTLKPRCCIAAILIRPRRLKLLINVRFLHGHTLQGKVLHVLFESAPIKLSLIFISAQMERV